MGYSDDFDNDDGLSGEFPTGNNPGFAHQAGAGEALGELAAELLGADAPASPALLHGTICGLAVSLPGALEDVDAFPLHDLVELLGAAITGDERLLELFIGATVTALTAESLDFAPLLPDDDAPLESRLIALADWCSGFLRALATGLARLQDGFGDESGPAALPPEIQEVIDDLAAIAEVDPDEEFDLDAEAQFMELAEFVKVATLLILSVVGHGLADPDE